MYITGRNFFSRILLFVVVATAHFQFALGHDTGNYIVTQGWGSWPGRETGARHGRAGAQQDDATHVGLRVEYPIWLEHKCSGIYNFFIP